MFQLYPVASFSGITIIRVGRIMALAILSVLIGITPKVVFAQGNTGTLEEIVVTAQRRPERLQNTPISITAFTSKDLQAQHINQLNQIARSTPNLTFDTGTFTSGTNIAAAVFIRGIGQIDYTPTTEAGVGVYLDGVNVGTSVGSVLNLVDIDHVEVLRGPQGTLFGRNTIGGAINVITKKPDNTLHGDLKVTTGSYGRIDALGRVNVPLTDTLFAKVSAATFNRGGFVHTPNAKSSGELGDMGRAAFRGALRFVPNDRFEVNLTGDYTRVRENSTPHVRVANYLDASLAQIAARKDPSSPSYIPPPAPVGRAPSFDSLYNILVGIPFIPYGYQPAYVTPPSIIPNPLFGLPPIGPDNVVNIQHDRLVNPSSSDLSSKADIWGVALTWSYDLDWATVKSISAYRKVDAKSDYSIASVQYPTGENGNVFNTRQFTQELDLTGKAIGSRLKWVLGFYHFQLQGYQLNDVAFTPVRILSGSKVDNSSNAGFGQATFDVTDKLSITGGIRYTAETKKFLVPSTCYPLPNGPATLLDGTVVTCAQLQTVVNPIFTNPGFLTTINAPVFPFSSDPNARVCCLPISDANGNVVGLVPGLTPGYEVLPRGTVERSFSDVTGLASVSYRWTGDLMTYFSFSTGFKGGGFVQRVFPPATEVASFAPETAQVFEGGVKWTGFNRRVRLDADGFHTDYDNLQIQVNNGIAPVTRNAGQAAMDGFELQLTALPATGWLVQGGVGYLDAYYTKLSTSQNFSTDIREITLHSKFVDAPRWSTNLGVQYSYQVPRFGGTLTGRVDWSYRSEVYNDALNFPVLRQGPLSLVNLGLTYVSPTQTWEVSAFGKNVTDERYIVSGSVNALSQGRAVANLGRPAEWGLSIAYHFGK